MKKIKMLIICGLVLTVAGCTGAGGGAIGGNPNEVLATVNGEKITDKDVIEEVGSQMQRIETEIFKIKERGLNAMVDKILLEQAAKKQGKTVAEYMKEQVENKISEPTEKEIKQYYDVRKKQMGDKKFDDVKGQIKAFLINNQKRGLERKLISGLKAGANIDIKMDPPRAKIEIGDSPSRGPKDAKITIVEFSDYQCPFCGRARPTIAKVLEKYPNDVMYVFKDFPLSFHKHAQKGHEAAHCAGDQGKYWEYSKELFSNQRKMSEADLKKYAKKIGLDMKNFDECLTSGKYEKRVKQSTKEGSMAGVSGTPAFFINGIMISGARPFSAFQEVIDAELQRN